MEKKIINEIAKNINMWINNKFDNKNVDNINEIKSLIVQSIENTKEKVNKWCTVILFNEGYGKQCINLEPFEAKTKKEAQLIAIEQVNSFYNEKINADIIDFKIKKIDI